jgi:hypothetical protein
LPNPDELVASVKAAPLEWSLGLVVPFAFLVGNLLGSGWDTVPFVIAYGIVLAIPGVALCTALHRTRRIGLPARWFGSIAVVALCGSSPWLLSFSGDPFATGFAALGVASAATFLFPLLSEPDARVPTDNALAWQRMIRFWIHIGNALFLAFGLTVVAAFTMGMLESFFPGLVAFDLLLHFYVSATTLGVVAVIGDLLKDGPESRVRLTFAEHLVSRVIFVTAACITVAVGAVLFAFLAYASLVESATHNLGLQTFHLFVLSSMGALAFLFGYPLIDADRDGASPWLAGIGKLMRLFPICFVVLFAWVAPTIATEWNADHLDVVNGFCVLFIVVAAAYCVLFTTFRLLDRRLPFWVLPTFYAFGTLSFAVVTTVA